MTGYRKPTTAEERDYWARVARDEREMLDEAIAMVASLRA